jgi:branched-chain amino acid transport system substrate-binding protein
MKRTVLAALTAAAALAALAAGCGGGDDGGGEAAPETTAPAETAAPAETGAPADTGAPAEAIDCTASIGVMAPITGDAASIGTEQLNWAKFAVDQYNEANGTTFTIVEGDTQLDPAQASTVAPQFVSNEEIVAVVGPAGSQEVDAVGTIFSDANMPFVSMSATATTLTTEGSYPTFFRVVPRDDDQGPTDATYMADDLGATKVMVIDDQSSYSTGLADQTQAALEEAGVEVVRESVSQDQTDFSALVSNVPDDAQFVFLPWQIAANAQLFGNQLQEQGKTAVIFGSDGLFSPDFTIAGSYLSAFAPDINEIPEDAELVEAYTAEYGEFGTFGPPTFAAATVLMDAIAAVCAAGETPTRELVLEQVRQTNQATSILGGPIQFDENGDILERRFYIFQINDDASYTLVQ